MEPTALPNHANIYNNIPEHPVLDIPAEGPSHRETNNNVLLYPTLPYPPFTSGMPTTGQGVPQNKLTEPNPNPNPKLLAVPSQMKVMALFRRKSRDANSSGAPRQVDDGLPEEYLHPPPYAPGYY